MITILKRNLQKGIENMNRVVIYLLALGVFLTGTVEMVVAGILNVIATDLNISITLAGQLITGYSLAFAIGTPILIALTARMERKKLLIWSLFIFVTGCFISYTSSNYSILMISRVVLGISAGLFSVIALSSAAKLVPPKKVGSAIGVIGLGFGSAIAFGVPIGIAITNIWNWHTIFLVLGIVSLCVMLGLLRLLPRIEGDAPIPFRQQFMVIKNPIIISALFISLFMCTSNSIMLTYIAPFLQDILHLDATELAYMMLILGIASIIGSRLGGTGVDKLGTTKMITSSLLVSGLALLIIPMFTNPVFLGLVFITIWMMSIFMTSPAIQSYFIQQAPQTANLVLSLNMTIVHIGTAVGAATGGWIVGSVSTVKYNPWVAGGAIVIALFLSIISFSLRKEMVFVKSSQ